MSINKLMPMFLSSALAFPTNVNATDAWASTQAYIDTREYATLNITGGASNLPLGLDFFGFTDIKTDRENGQKLKAPYAELALSKKLFNGFGPIVQYDRSFEFSEGTIRAGVTYSPNISKYSKDTRFGIDFFPVSTNNQGAEISFSGKKEWNEGNNYISGFLDYDFKPGKIITEVQLGKRIKNNLFGVVEFRYNEYKTEDFGVAAGFELKF